MIDNSLPIKAVQKIRPLGGKLTSIPENHKERQAAKYKGLCYIEGLHYKKKLSLTFDDGPSALTCPLLDLLKALGVSATFFWIGQNLEKFADLVRRAHIEGHTFGNHSFDHLDFTGISTDEVVCQQVGKTQLIYRNLLGIEPALVRPPYGEVTDEQIEALNRIGLKIIFWSIDAGDWITEFNSEVKISSRVLNTLHEEAIILMHDGGSASSSTVHAVKAIVEGCRGRGYEFVSVNDLISAEKSLENN